MRKPSESGKGREARQAFERVVDDLSVSESMSCELNERCKIMSLNSKESMRKRDMPGIRANKDRLEAAILVFKETSSEYLGQSMSKLANQGFTSDNVVQRTRKMGEAIEEARQLIVEATNQVLIQEISSSGLWH